MELMLSLVVNGLSYLPSSTFLQPFCGKKAQAEKFFLLNYKWMFLVQFFLWMEFILETESVLSEANAFAICNISHENGSSYLPTTLNLFT